MSTVEGKAKAAASPLDKPKPMRLGDFEFMEFEIPEELPFGVTQTIRAHKFVGDGKALDAMGADQKPMSWSGRIRGPDAIARARKLKRMTERGLEVPLTWGDLAYTVLIEAFDAQPQSPREVPYNITVQVLRDDASPTAGAAPISATSAVKADGKKLTGLAKVLNDPKLIASVQKVNAAISAAGDLAVASKAVLNTVLAPGISVQDRLAGLTVAAESVFRGQEALGGVLPGLPGRELVAGFASTLRAAQDSASLYEASAFMGRIEVNVGSLSTSGSRVVVAGADLFEMARDAYGLATAWDTIARANGRSDPRVTGIAEIVIPPSAVDAGGVL